MDNYGEGDNQRRIFALVLCVILGFIYIETVWKPYFGPGQQGAAPHQPTPTPTPAGELYTEPSAAPTSVPQPQAELRTPAQPADNSRRNPDDSEVQAAGLLTVETNQIKANISLLGGRVTELFLTGYRAELGDAAPPLNLVKHVEPAPYPLGVYLGETSDARILYRVASAPAGTNNSFDLRRTAERGDIVLEGQLPDNRRISKKLTFYPEGYFIDVQVQIDGAAGAPPAALEWTKLLRQQDASILDPYAAQGFVWYDGRAASRLIFTKLEGQQQQFGPVRWVSMDDKYFVVSVLSRGPLLSAEGIRSGQLYRTRITGQPDGFQLSLFCGPKSYELLSDLGHNLQLNVNLGKTGLISAPLLWLLHLFYALVQNYGVAIVCLTIFVRLLLYPLNASTFRQMKAMQDLKPEMDRIREQFADKQAQQMEMMALYKKRGVNPMGGCLPVLIQLPIFIGLYSALMLAVELRHAPYALWINDLSAPEKLMIGNFGLPVMVILFVATMLLQQWMTPSAMDPVQKKVMMVMPVVFGFMFANMPAGLTLYYLTGNIIGIGQQKAMQHFQGDTRRGLLVTTAVSAAVLLLTFLLSLL